MLKRTEEEIVQELNKIYDKIWVYIYSQKEKELAEGRLKFRPNFFERQTEIKQQIAENYNESELNIRNSNDIAILYGKYNVLFWALGYEWRHYQDLNLIRNEWSLNEMTTNNNRIYLSYLREKT